MRQRSFCFYFYLSFYKRMTCFHRFAQSVFQLLLPSICQNDPLGDERKTVKSRGGEMVLDQMRLQSCCSLVLCKQPRTVNTSATAEIRNASDSENRRRGESSRHVHVFFFLCHFVERIHRRRKAMGFLAPADRGAPNDDARRDIGLHKAGVERSLMMPDCFRHRS